MIMHFVQKCVHAPQYTIVTFTRDWSQKCCKIIMCTCYAVAMVCFWIINGHNMAAIISSIKKYPCTRIKSLHKASKITKPIPLLFIENQILTTAFPVLSPLKRPAKASNMLSKPSVTCSVYFSFPCMPTIKL